MNAHVTFTDAVLDDTSLLIGIAGASGSGKTMSALRLATGLAQGEPIYGIDTEARRMLHYAARPGDMRAADELLREGKFRFKHYDMKPPFTPESFAGAIDKAVRSGAKVIIVDSMSDEYEGVGGLQEMHDDEVSRLARKPFGELEGWQIDKFNAPAWKVPKTRHKTKLIAPLRQVRAYVIFCMRAEEKIRFVKIKTDDGREKTAIENAGWTPICEKRFMYDMTMSFTVTPDRPGVPLIVDGEAVYGKLQRQHLPFFPEGRHVTEDAGRMLRAWARGENSPIGEPTSSQAGRQDAGGHVSSQSPASAQIRDLLLEYHAALSGEAFRQDLEERHEQWRPRFTDAPDVVRRAGRRVLSIHTDRVEGRIGADAAAGQAAKAIEEAGL